MKRQLGSAAFALLELLIAIAIITILILLLLPSLRFARELARQSACASNLRQIGQAGEAYSTDYDDWLVGSPNTSGSGANPGGDWISLYYPQTSTYRWDANRDAYPAVHIFDWATPLLQVMRGSVPQSIPQRYAETKVGIFLCPSNHWSAYLNHVSRISIETMVSSYATSRFFTYVPASLWTGTVPGTRFWSDDFVPETFAPRLSRIENASGKVFLADCCKVDRDDPHRTSNMDYGYTERGAWLNEKNPDDKGRVSLAYRFTAAREQAYRHRAGLNLLCFDGHVEYQREGSSEDNNGYGSGSRQAKFWFPSGTNTGKLPSAGDFSNRKIIVP